MKSANVGIVSHDAGGANLVSHWVLNQNLLSPRFCLDGPAINIFRSVIPQVRSLELADTVGDSDWLLCGSSWSSDLEVRAIRLAREQSKKSICLLDHWVNYEKRFFWNGELSLPDEIWVTDLDAATLARRHFPHTAVKIKPNHYLEDSVSEVLKLTKKFQASRPSEVSAATVVYLCEPIAEHMNFAEGNAKALGYDEFDCLDYFFAKLSSLHPTPTCVIIRPHPSEDSQKYRKYLKTKTCEVKISRGLKLAADLAKADIIVGASTMALVIAYLSRKTVFSTIPKPDKSHGIMPYPIPYLHDLKNAAR